MKKLKPYEFDKHNHSMMDHAEKIEEMTGEKKLEKKGFKIKLKPIKIKVM